jgi:alpha-L-fucosidase
MGNGEIEPSQADRLQEVGEWLETYGISVYSTLGGPFPSTIWGSFTHKDDHLYVHVVDWLENEIVVSHLPGEVIGIRSLTASEVLVKNGNGNMHLSVSKADRQTIDTIFEIQMISPIAEQYN